MADVRLRVNGRRYAGWQAVRITRSIESVSGSFDLEVSDRWAGQKEPWPIAEEDACRVEVDGVVVLDGFVDRRSLSLSASDRTLSISGRDKTAALVDCSAVLDKWSFRDVTALEVARKVAAPFGIGVSVQEGITLPKVRKLAISPGDTALSVIERAAESAGVLLVSDGAGGLLLTRAGTGRATPIIEGENLLTGSVTYDATERFSRYVIATQAAGNDHSSGAALRVRAEATDENVRRTERALFIRPESGLSTEGARQRADWEARVRAARAETVSIGLHGWTQPGGSLWPLGALVAVMSPALGVDGDLLISQVEHSLDEGGENTRLSLVRPDAFTPEPAATVKSRGKGSGWKQPAGGAT